MKLFRIVGFIFSGVFLLGLMAPADQVTEAYRDSSFIFTKAWRDGGWDLEYRFKGLGNKGHEVKCRVVSLMKQQVEESYGFQSLDRNSAVALRLKRRIDEEGIRERVLYYGESKVVPSYDKQKKDWFFNTFWAEVPDRIRVSGDWAKSRAERDRFTTWYRERGAALLQEAETEFMSSKGFVYDREMGFISNYSRLIILSTPAMEGCIEALNRETLGNAEILMNFFQSMPYERIDLADAKTKKWTGGLLLPPSLMVQGKGDCDSKAAAFCTIQRTYPDRLVIFRSFRKKGDDRKGHALVGVEAFAGRKKNRSQRQKWSGELPPWKRTQLFAGILDKPMVVDNRYYTLCEVAGGTGTVPYGEVAPGKQGWYVVMPIQPLDQYIEAPRPGKK
jgi:hypothetical protein